MVTSNHHLASDAGAQILSRGGNAVDAAIATSIALGVVEPTSSGIGGRGYMVVHLSSSGTSAVIDGHERAPHRAGPDMFAIRPESDDKPSDEATVYRSRTKVENDANTDGPLAVAVPGVLGALATAHTLFGSLPWSELFEPAIALSEDGFDVSVPLSLAISRNFRKLASFPETAATFLPNGAPMLAGERLVQSDLARSLTLIARNGPREFYEGSIARSIEDAVVGGGGILDRDDLAAFRPRVWDWPLTGAYRGYQLLTVPEAAGGITLVQMMNLLEAFELGDLEPADPRYLHIFIEASRIAFRDRLAFVDDPEFAQVPFNGLVSKEFAKARSSEIDTGQARNDLPPGNPWEFEGTSTASHPGSTMFEFGNGDSDTTHFCVVDADRTVVSMTQSLINAFGSGVTVPGTGILLNNAMFNFNPVPGQLGSIGPWKRAAHFGTPTIVLSPDGTPRMAIGGAGGPKILTGVVQTLVNVLDRDLALQDAIAHPRVHNEGRDSLVDIRIEASARAVLARMGHRLATVRPEYGRSEFSLVNGIRIDEGNTLFSGVDVFSDAGATATDH